MEAVCAWSRRAGSPADAADAIAAAFAAFARRAAATRARRGADRRAGRRGRGRSRSAPRHRATAPALDEAAVERAAALRERAERPALILGGGARAAADAATRLAERLGAPVVTTVNGKGIVSERHPLSLGAQIRLRATQRWLAGRDVVLAVGTELGESDLWGPPLRLGGRLIRVDVDPGQLHKNAAADVPVAGAARAALDGLLAALPADRSTVEDLRAARAAIRGEALADGAPFVALIGALDEALGRDGVLSGDSTMASYYGAVHFLPMDAARRWIYPTGYATLGYAVPAAIGAKLAAPERPVIALVGDGGLLFTVAELAMAAELGIPLPVVVPNNGGYGEIRAQMRAEDIDPIGVDLRVPDLPALGRAFGGAGLRAGDPAALGPALREALERPGPTVIEVPAS